jgi:rRNA maturation protein Nop10
MTTLRRIEDAIRSSWGPDTVDPDDGWNPANPSRGQCDVTALVVHDIFGGELLAADVFVDGERVEGHMWNRLPGGHEVDLTRDQFENGQVIGEPVARPRPATFDPQHPRHHRYEAYRVLARKVQERLHEAGAFSDDDTILRQ